MHAHTHTPLVTSFNIIIYVGSPHELHFPLNSDAITHQHINEGAYLGNITISKHKMTLRYKLLHPRNVNMLEWQHQSSTIHLAMFPLLSICGADDCFLTLPPYRRGLG